MQVLSVPIGRSGKQGLYFNNLLSLYNGLQSLRKVEGNFKSELKSCLQSVTELFLSMDDGKIETYQSVMFCQLKRANK